MVLSRLDRYWPKFDFDDDGSRAKFRRALMRRAADCAHGRRATREILTPYWESGFNDWLLYEGTLAVCGAVCTERTDGYCTFEADASGVQSEGICMLATFVIPTREFTDSQLAGIVPGCGEYHPLGRRCLGDGVWVADYGPFDDGRYVKSLAWWYDGYYDGVDGE